jgi:hypothetical protein
MTAKRKGRKVIDYLVATTKFALLIFALGIVLALIRGIHYSSFSEMIRRLTISFVIAYGVATSIGIIFQILVFLLSKFRK